MMQLIRLFSPALLATAMLQKLQEAPLHNWDMVFSIGIFAGIINMLSIAVIAILFGNPTTLISEVSRSAALSWKYLALSFFFSLVLPYTYNTLRQIVKNELSIKIDPTAFASDLKKTERDHVE